MDDRATPIPLHLDVGKDIATSLPTGQDGGDGEQRECRAHIERSRRIAKNPDEKERPFVPFSALQAYFTEETTGTFLRHTAGSSHRIQPRTVVKRFLRVYSILKALSHPLHRPIRLEPGYASLAILKLAFVSLFNGFSFLSIDDAIIHCVGILFCN